MVWKSNATKMLVNSSTNAWIKKDSKFNMIYTVSSLFYWIATSDACAVRVL